MTEDQRNILNILKTFDAVCRRHGIVYFATGGTALGAIRHGGFIPWDDDIDLGMTRPMWERLKPALIRELPERYVLVDRFGYQDYRNPIARIVDMDTTSIHRGALANESPKGQFIEVFVHDPVPSGNLSEHKRAFLLFCELLSPYQAVLFEKYRFKRGLKDDELEILKEFPAIREEAEKRGKDTVLNELEKIFSEFEYDLSDYLLLGWGTNTLYYPIDSYDGIRYEVFEDMEVPVPRRACDNLRIDYGNRWPELPPLEKRRTHPGVIDNDVSWTEYMDLINKRISPEKTRAMRLAQKEIQLKALPDRVMRDKILFDVKMRSAQALDEQTSDLASMWERGEHKAITDRFKGYIDLKKKVIAYTFDKDIREESRRIIAASLVMHGRMDEAECVLDMQRNERLSGSDSVLVGDIKRLREAKTLYYDKLYEEADEMLSGVSGDMKCSLPYRMAAARLAIVRGDSPDDAAALHEEYPDDLEIAKIYADALVFKGKGAEAEKIYNRIVAESNNGMDVIDIVNKRAGRS